MQVARPNSTLAPEGNTRLFTAAQIARALDLSPRAIRMKLPETKERLKIRGQEANAWTLGTLPPVMQEELRQIADRQNFRTAEELLRTGEEAVASAQSSPAPAQPAREWHADLARQFVESEMIEARENLSIKDREWAWGLICEHFYSLLRTMPGQGEAEEGRNRRQIKKSLISFLLDKEHGLPGLIASAALNPSKALDMALERRLAFYETEQGRGEIRDRRADASGDRDLKWKIEGESQALREDGLELPKWFVPAAQFFWLNCNRTWKDGSVPEAVLRTVSLPVLPTGWKAGLKARLLKKLNLDKVPECPEDLRELILQKRKDGKPMVPDRIAEMIRQPEAMVTYARSPKRFDLDYLSCPGSMRLQTLPDGSRARIRGGEWIEADDGTPGIAVCVPWDRCGTKCAENFGVMLGRFQWLPFMDAAWDYVLGFTYVIRPRSSYRREDILAGMKGVCKGHGIPRKGWRFERGTWESRMVRQAVKDLGTQLWTVHSAHNKIIEILFNRVWTKLAVQFPHADLGRYRGENEKNCRIYDLCKAGGRDPRHYFPMLADVIAAFVEVLAEHNGKRIKSRNYGAWVPEERWKTDAQHLRKLKPEEEWMFAPQVGEWTVHGMTVGGKVPLFEEFSVPFDFSAPWLPDYHGAKVRVHFDPMEPRCIGTVVLREPFHGKKAGTVLGPANQINETAQYARLQLGWGDDPVSAGKIARQQAAAYVRRETRSIMPGGKVGHAFTEIRDGISQVAVVEKDGKVIPEVKRLVEPLRIPPTCGRAADDPTLQEFLDGAGEPGSEEAKRAAQSRMKRAMREEEDEISPERMREVEEYEMNAAMGFV